MRIRLSGKTSLVSLRYGIAALLMLAVLVLAACGTSAAPESGEAAATATPTTVPATSASDPPPADTEEPGPSAMLAPTFELPSGTGGTVNLASFAGDKNVVLVFYRGFW